MPAPGHASASPTPAAPESSADGPPLPAEEASRRRFLQASLLGVGALGAISAPSLAHAQTSALKRTFSHYHIARNDKTVHWGYFQQEPEAARRDRARDFVTLETVTHHAMTIASAWWRATLGSSRSLLGQEKERRRSAGRRARWTLAVWARLREGLGVHVCTGPSRQGRGARATSSRCASWTSSFAPPSTRSTRARPSAATQPPGGAFTTRI
jgi:hypothetical protein